MVEASLNIFDLGVIIVIGLSALLSFFRGFVREVLSLGAWLGAGIITLYSFPAVSKWLLPQVKSEMVASGLASMGVFICSLILLSILLGVLLKFLKPGSEVGFLDNFIGLLFGVARGVLVVSIAYFVMTIVINEKDLPEWLEGSLTRPYVAKSAAWVAAITPSYMDEIIAKDGGDGDGENAEAVRNAKAQIQEKTEEAADRLEEEGKSMPSFEELQRRVREENEGR
jgi:membrane protein required for colicin V production